MTTLELINQFFSQKRIALIGASRNPGDFSRGLMKELLTRGIDVVPVNTRADEIDGKPCAKSIQEVTPEVSAALILTPKDGMMQAVSECASAGVGTVWLFGIKGPKEIPAEVIELCARRAMTVIPGYCPYMFLENAGWFHRLHGSFNRLVGAFPA